MSDLEVTQSKPPILDRRNSSLIDHINRIREANSKRKSVSLWNTLESIKTTKPGKAVSIHNLTCNNKISAASSPSFRRLLKTFDGKSSLDDLFSYRSKNKNLNDNLSTFSQNTISLDSVKVDRNQQPTSILKPKTTSRKKFISQKRRNSEGSAATLSTPTKSTRKNFRRAKSKQKLPKIPPSPKSTSKSLKKKQDQGKIDNKSFVSEESIQSHHYNNRQMTTNLMQQITDSKESLTSKEIIVMNWLHELSCPKSEKSKIRENGTVTVKNKRFPIRIVKKPLNDSMNQDSNEKNVAVRKISEPSSKNNKTRIKTKTETTKRNHVHSGEEIRTKSPNKDRDKKSEISNKDEKSSDSDSTERSKENIEDISNTIMNSKTNKSGETEKQIKSATIDESCKKFNDVEINISDSGKVQIVFDLKSFSSDDAAVLIWLDDLPKFIEEALQRKPLSKGISTGTPNKTRTSFKSNSAIELEDTISPRPDIYFPSVTILKNLAVDSKVGLRELNEDRSNSVYYTRCNLAHIDSE